MGFAKHLNPLLVNTNTVTLILFFVGLTRIVCKTHSMALFFKLQFNLYKICNYFYDKSKASPNNPYWVVGGETHNYNKKYL